MKRSFGSRCFSARMTVSPPIPESNIPMACAREPSLIWRSCRWIGKIVGQYGGIDVRQLADLRNGHALVHFVHRATRKTHLGDRATASDEARVRRAPRCREFRACVRRTKHRTRQEVCE